MREKEKTEGKKKGKRRGIPMSVFKILKESQINSHTLTIKSLLHTRHPPLPLNIGVSTNGAVKGIRTCKVKNKAISFVSFSNLIKISKNELD